jgi:hypothetical protein
MKKKILNVIAAAFTAAARRISQHVTDSGIAVLDRTTPMALPGATPMREAGAERIAAVVVGAPTMAEGSAWCAASGSRACRSSRSTATRWRRRCIRVSRATS